jgi:histidyl-tRNA synthetase
LGDVIHLFILEIKRQGIQPPMPLPVQAFVVSFGKTATYKDAALQITAQLRQAGIKAEMSYGDRSRKAQMKQANVSGAAYAVIIGEEELANGLVSVKDLRAAGMEMENKQIQIPREQIIDFLRSHQ